MRNKAPALLCASCETRIDGAPPMCAGCGRPTPFASYEELTAWEVAQWRSHTSNGSSHEAPPAPPPPPRASARQTPHDAAEPMIEGPVAVAVLERGPADHPERAPLGTEPAAAGIHRRCLHCGGSDWVLRAGRNEDDTWRYWCVRCSLAFRTNVRLRHAAKPWLISATVLTALAIGTARFT